MADTDTVPLDVSDKELFQSAIEEVPKETTAEPIEAEQPRDEQGRFAPKAKEAEAAPIQQPVTEQPTEPKTDEGGQVPSWRLREVREARETAERRAQEAERQSYAVQAQLQAMQREMAQLRQPKQEPVDFFADPDAALKQRIDPLTSQFQTIVQDMQRELSETKAIARYGAEAYAAMETELQAAMVAGEPEVHQLRAQALSSRDPAAVAMQWYQQRKVMKEVGNDPTKYKQRILDEAAKDPAFQAKVMEAARSQASTSRPNVQLPPSLNRAPGSGVGHATLDEGDMSDAALFRHAITAPRR